MRLKNKTRTWNSKGGDKIRLDLITGLEATAWCRRTDFPFGSGTQEGIGTGKPTYLVLVSPQPVLGLLRIGETHEPGWVCQAAPLLVCGEVTTFVPRESEHRRVAWHMWDGAEVWCVTLTEKATSLGEKQEYNTEWWTLISHCLTLYLESNYIAELARKIHLTAPFWKGIFLPAYIDICYVMRNALFEENFSPRVSLLP